MAVKGAGDALEKADPALYECFIHAKLMVLTGGRLPEGDLSLGGFDRVLEWLAASGILEWTVRSMPGL